MADEQSRRAYCVLPQVRQDLALSHAGQGPGAPLRGQGQKPLEIAALQKKNQGLASHYAAPRRGAGIQETGGARAGQVLLRAQEGDLPGPGSQGCHRVRLLPEDQAQLRLSGEPEGVCVPSRGQHQVQYRVLQYLGGSESCSTGLSAAHL